MLQIKTRLMGRGSSPHFSRATAFVLFLVLPKTTGSGNMCASKFSFSLPPLLEISVFIPFFKSVYQPYKTFTTAPGSKCASPHFSFPMHIIFWPFPASSWVCSSHHRCVFASLWQCLKSLSIPATGSASSFQLLTGSLAYLSPPSPEYHCSELQVSKFTGPVSLPAIHASHFFGPHSKLTLLHSVFKLNLNWSFFALCQPDTAHPLH